MDVLQHSALIKEALVCLREGKAVAFPTDTVAGLGVAVAYAPSPAQLYAIKGRDSSKPIAWLVGSIADLEEYGADVPAYARALARRHWPGALTLVVKASARVPESYRCGVSTIGLRMPNHPVPLALAQALGCPLAATSANLSGQASVGDSSSIDPAVQEAAAFVIEGGQQASAIASTVVDCTGVQPVVLRQGDVVV